MAFCASPREDDQRGCLEPSGANLLSADPVAGVLDWLGRYDFRESIAIVSGVDNKTGGSGGASSSRSTGQHERFSSQEDKACPPSGSASKDLQPQPFFLPVEEDVSEEMASAEVAQVPKLGTIRPRGHDMSAKPAGHAPAGSRPPSLAQSAPRISRGAENGKVSAWSLCRPASACLPEIDPDSHGLDAFQDEEEVEWDTRQRKSGTVGRLAVYHAGDCPREDVVLRGGGRKHIVVAGVREGGQAARVGVRAGDRLVSIDGKKDFLGLTADAVSDNLVAPSVLVFLGFVGKLQAEVRLTCGDSVCGVSARHDIAKGSADAPVTLCEQRTFNAGIASLFLTVNAAEEIGSQDGGHPSFSPQLPLFELQHREAHSLVKRALKRLEAKEMIAKEAENAPSSSGATMSSASPQLVAQFGQTPSPVSQLKLDFMDRAMPEIFSPPRPVQTADLETTLDNGGNIALRVGSRVSSPAQPGKDADAIDPFFV